jgi:hypothetical protein
MLVFEASSADIWLGTERLWDSFGDMSIESLEEIEALIDFGFELASLF